jgi:hypothetical protein
MTEMEQLVDLYLPPAVAQLDIGSILNTEKLLRLHPHWFVEDVQQNDEYMLAKLRDYDTEKDFSLALVLDGGANRKGAVDAGTVFRIALQEYGATEIVFFTDKEKTRVRITYLDENPTEECIQDVLLWIRGIQEYLRLYLRTTPRTLFFRLVMNKMVLQMNPSQRKICLMIARVTVVELVVTLVIVIGYVNFGR